MTGCFVPPVYDLVGGASRLPPSVSSQVLTQNQSGWGGTEFSLRQSCHWPGHDCSRFLVQSRDVVVCFHVAEHGRRQRKKQLAIPAAFAKRRQPGSNLCKLRRVDAAVALLPRPGAVTKRSVSKRAMTSYQKGDDVIPKVGVRPSCQRTSTQQS